MPYNESDAERKTKKADTPKKRRQWKEIANKLASEGKPEATAIKIANAAVKNRPAKKGPNHKMAMGPKNKAC